MRIKKCFLQAIAVIALQGMLILVLSGCWNNRDLSEINMVVALGIDKTEDGNVLLTVQVVEPAAVQSSASGKGKGGGTQPKPVFVVTYEGETIFDALRGMLSEIDKKLFISTVQVVILGEQLAKDGIYEMVDFLQRDHEVEYKMDVLVAKEVTPKELLEMETDIDSIPAMYIKGTIENTKERAKVKRTLFIDLIKDLGSNGKQPVLGQITKAGEKKVRTEGAAVFKDGQLKGWLEPYETQGYLFATNGVKSTIVNIPAEGGKDEKISIEIIRSKGKIAAEFTDGEPIMLSIRVILEANVGEYEGFGRLSSPDKLRALEEALSKKIKDQITMVVNLAQKKYSSDIFGFGIQVHKYHPQYWKKVKDNWNDVFSSLPVEIKVEAKIMHTGAIKDPIKNGR